MEVDTSRTLNELITAVSMAMDIEEGVKLYHGWRVAVVAARLSDVLGGRNVMENFYGGVVHDVGGVGLPHHVVNYLGERPGLYDERSLDPAVVSHPLLSAEIVNALPGISGAARAVLNHHESWNGHGFPRGLQGDEIGLDAQVLRAADVADLMLRDQDPPSLPATVERLARLAGTSLSPEITDVLIEELREGLFDDVADTDRLPGVFESTRERAGRIPVERGVDAIGVTLEVLSRVVDNKHPYTIGHSRRVARYALLIGIAMGLDHQDLTRLKWAALLHDVGKLSVPCSMLNKPTSLTDDEFELVKFHVSYTFDIVSMITDLRAIAAVASGHHEHYDGSGYPLGWAGDDIPPGSRIIAVSDAFDAMTSHRPYRSVNNTTAACEEIERKAGTQFDPAVTKVAVPVLRSLGLIVMDA